MKAPRCRNNQQTVFVAFWGLFVLLILFKSIFSQFKQTRVLLFYFPGSVDGLLFASSFYSEGNFGGVVFLFCLLEKQDLVSRLHLRVFLLWPVVGLFIVRVNIS